jgi:hypothetical protein
MGKRKGERSKKSAELQKFYLEFLSSEGYGADLDKGGHVVFTRGDLHFRILIDARDPQFLMLTAPGIWTVDDDGERARVLLAMNDTNCVVKAVKLMLLHGQVSAGTEAYFQRPEDLRGVFRRMLSSVEAGIAHFLFGMALQEAMEKHIVSPEARCHGEQPLP